MKKYLSEKIVRIRCRKSYPEAHVHTLIGRVLEETAAYLVVEGKSFHFGSAASSAGIVNRDRSKINVGGMAIRCLPWTNVEIIHLLDAKADYTAEFKFDDDGNLVLCDKRQTVIAYHREVM